MNRNYIGIGVVSEKSVEKSVKKIVGSKIGGKSLENFLKN